jgi:hypothetical protein
MPATPAPLFFSEALQFPGLWAELQKTYGLTRKDFEWFKHIELTSQPLRSRQSPAMIVERVLLATADQEPVPLAGTFVLSPSPDTNGVIVYTPYAGIQKHHSREALTAQLVQRLNAADEDDDLLALMSLGARKTLAASDDIRVTYEVIEGDVFDDQRRVVAHYQQLNHQAMLDELAELPTLASLLDGILDERLKPTFGGLDQRQTQVNFYTVKVEHNATQGSEPTRRWHSSLSLRDAVLQYLRDQRWPAGQTHEFTHPKRTSSSTDQQHWETALQSACGKLLPLLFQRLESYWVAATSSDGASRRVFFSRAIREQARAEILLKREAQIISPEQSHALQTLFQESSIATRRPTLETVRLWENKANPVELAGSLMISHTHACLYTPTQGLQVLEDYQDLNATLLSKFSASGHEDELYGLLSLDERSRFIGFDQPHVSGEVIYGPIFAILFEAIITKQRQNIEYALQVFRHSEGAVNIHALFDKALDIRSMISERLLSLDAHGRWSTRPILVGNKKPSAVRADTAAAYVKTFIAVETPISADFAAQPITSLALQRVYLERMKPQIAHVLSVGIRGEASLRVLATTLQTEEQSIVDTVFNPDQPDRKSRRALNGFRPDAYTLILECTGQKDQVPLANCVLLTERGGLDEQHSGRTILWTPAAGLEVFDSVNRAKQLLNLRLLDPRKRLELLENLPLAQYRFHERYSIHSLRLIEGNVLRYLTQSSIENFLAACEHIRSRKLAQTKQYKALNELTKRGIDTNLRRATHLSRAISRQQSLPAWLGMAPVAEQQLHIELLEQYRNSVTDDKDYLHGIPTLLDYTRDRLQALLAGRFPGQSLASDEIEITPNLALAGPARTLTEFALNHVNIAQGTGFKIASTTTTTLPEGLNQNAVQQLLRSLNIDSVYADRVADKLTGADTETRKLRFAQQLPWQLLQHAHALKLQQRLSTDAFDLISQVLDMPDATARAMVEDAHAIVRPLELIKTAGAAAIKALGVYLISPGAGHHGPHVLYTPYLANFAFSEFENEASVVAAINAPGSLQDLVVRRLPENQQSIFRNLFKSTIGQESEITLASSPIDGNLMDSWFSDNVSLLRRMLGSRAEVAGQSDWGVVKQLFSSGIKLASGLLPGKLAYVPFLWQSFKDFEASAEALQNHHWQRALQAFIAGTVQMVSLGRLSLEDELVTSQATPETAPTKTTVTKPKWSQVKLTAPERTQLQTFEAPTVSLKNLNKTAADGTFLDSVSKHRFAPIAGKVYRIDKPGAVWQILNASQDGPSLASTSTRQMVIDPDVHTVHYGKAMSKMRNEYATSHEARQVLNIEAQGMTAIRANHPQKARMIVQAVDMARYYAFNSLHNLSLQRQFVSGTRLDSFLKRFFDVSNVDAVLLDKIKQAIVPVCTALVDPDEDLMNTDRFIVGSNKYQQANLIAFVVNQDSNKNVHFTERFFDQQLDWYKSCLTEPFNVDGHSQAATLIHEFSHLFSKTLDIASLEARRPFLDLIAPITAYGQAMKQNQMDFQREALSLVTPKDELFARWNDSLQSWLSLDSITGASHIGKEILKVAGTTTMEAARDAFLDPDNAEKRIDIILRNADSIAFLICEMGRQLDPVPPAAASSP